jgi:SAM-dependent methyltransferase
MNWYETAFGSKYLDVYRHRDSSEAARALDLIEDACAIKGQNALVLDLACGQGRYSRLLAERGHSVAALDLSLPLLERGKAVSVEGLAVGGPVWYVRADMRALPLAGACDAAINMFTSFGYFTDDSDNARVLEQIALALRPGGRWVIDYLNRPQVIATLVPEDRSSRGGLRIHQVRRLEDSRRRVVKDVTIEGPEGRQQWTESVRMYGRDELERMLERAGLCVDRVYGDYECGPYAETTERLILTGHN